jgi:hypothetical protein
MIKAFIHLNFYDNYKHTFFIKNIILDEWRTACSTKAITINFLHLYKIFLITLFYNTILFII